MTLSDVFEKIRQVFHYKLFTVNETSITRSLIFNFLIVFLIWLGVARLIYRVVSGKLLACTRVEENTRHAIPRITQYTLNLLGVHIIGTQGAGLDYFLETVFNSPTLAESYKVAALDAYNKLTLC